MKSAVTQHALQRCDERMGLNKRAARRMAAKAHDEGITRSQTKGDLHYWLTAKEGRQGSTYTRIYGDHVYLFGDGASLITVIPLPREYRAAVAKIKRQSHANA